MKIEEKRGKKGDPFSCLLNPSRRLERKEKEGWG